MYAYGVYRPIDRLTQLPAVQLDCYTTVAYASSMKSSKDLSKFLTAIACAFLLGLIASADTRMNMRCRVVWCPRSTEKPRLIRRQTENRNQSATRWHMRRFGGIVSLFEPQTFTTGARLSPAALQPHPRGQATEHRMPILRLSVCSKHTSRQQFSRTCDPLPRLQQRRKRCARIFTNQHLKR